MSRSAPAFTASIGWYRAGAGAVARSLGENTPAGEDRMVVPTTVLWPEYDPLFPGDRSDRLDEFFQHVTRDSNRSVANSLNRQSNAEWSEPGGCADSHRSRDRPRSMPHDTYIAGAGTKTSRRRRPASLRRDLNVVGLPQTS